MKLTIAIGVAVVGIGMASCNRDKVLAGRRAINTEPEEAIAILQEAEKEKGPSFDSRIYLGLAYEKVHKDHEAIAAYEDALAMDDSARRPEPVKARLLAAYKRVFAASVQNGRRIALANKAAALEVELGVANNWANEFLHLRYQGDFDTNSAAGRHEEATNNAEAIQALYLTPSKKKAAAEKATRFEKEMFVGRSVEVFGKKLAGQFTRKGMFDAGTNEIVLKSRFTIPTVRANPAFDPAADNYMLLVRGKACLPVRDRLEDAVNAMVDGLGLGKPDSRELDHLFSKLFIYSKAGFEQYGGEKKRPAGQIFLCFIRVPLKAFLGEMFQFAE